MSLLQQLLCIAALTGNRYAGADPRQVFRVAAGRAVRQRAQYRTRQLHEVLGRDPAAEEHGDLGLGGTAAAAEDARQARLHHH